MSKTKIAPGPWGWECHPDTKKLIALSSNEGDVLLATGDENNSWMVVSETHQRALRAVPDLLAACRRMVEALSVHHMGGKEPFPGDRRYDEALSGLYEAIEKAAGL